MVATPRQGEAITMHDQSMVVTAGAGTGKTYVLVQKYIDLLKTCDVTVPQILALTFTEKAAAEMKERIRRELQQYEGPQWERAAEDFMIAPVQTFHSFCAQVLREFPIEAGLEPGFVVLDEQQVSRIHTRVSEDLVQTRQDGPVHEALVHLLSISGRSTLRTMLTAMYERRDRYARFFSALEEDEDRVVAEWRSGVEALRDAEIHALQSDPLFSTSVDLLLGFADVYEGVDDRAVAYLQDIHPLLSALAEPSSPEAFCTSAGEFLKRKPGNVGSKKSWKPDDLAAFKQARRNLNEILERKKTFFRMTVDPADPVIIGSVRFLHDLSRVFACYNDLVREEKAAAGGLDFSDLILYARDLFQNNDLVATHFTPRFRYILVDEFQDTDQVQFEIIRAIIGTPSPSTDCLFIVGDPKQSIYLFRDADVTRFKEAQEIISAVCKGRVVNLDTSFRSTKAVIDLENILFSRLLASAEKPWEFGYEQVCISKRRLDHAGSVELLLPAGSDDTAATKRNEAAMVARRVHSMVNAQPLEVYEEQPDHSFTLRPTRYGDIAILLAQRTNLSYYLSALGEYGIPFHVHGGTGFYRRQEVFDLYSILSFLEHRHDDISLVGVLRSPYFGLKDTELYTIAQEEGATLWEKLGKYAETTGSGPATRSRDLLAFWQQYAGRTGLVALIRWILAESGVYAVYAALPAGEQILANIEKLVGMARSREEAGPYSLADFTADLLMAMDEDEREGEAPLDTLAADAVNIMTVHAAKGLEFPIVVVPDMGVAFRDRSDPIMIGDNPLMVGVKVPNPAEDYAMTDSAVLLALREMQRQKERAEKKRLLYVALTRARDHLIMSGTRPKDASLSFDLAKSRLDWVFTALGITEEAIAAGEQVLELPDGAGSLRLAIVSDPATIPAETGRVEPSPIVVPAAYAGQAGTWTVPVSAGEPVRDRVYSVSELERTDGWSPVHERVVSPYLPGVDGTTKGTIIHEVLRGRDAGVVCAEYGVTDPLAVRQCEEIAGRFLSSAFMQQVKRSFCEMPFVVTLASGRRVAGTIDRLCELADGSWAVIDYKSDPVTPAGYASKAEEYALSLSMYCEAAEQLLGGKPAPGYLYFTETGEFSPIVVEKE